MSGRRSLAIRAPSSQNPQQLAPSHGCCGDSLGSRHTTLSRALSSQIRGDNGLAGPSRRAPDRPLIALSASEARAVSPRTRAAPSAASLRSRTRVTHDAQHFLDLADACEQAADPILQSATEMEAVVTAAPGWPGISSAAADRLARGVRLKEAAQHLRQDAHDVELLALLAHRAAGGDVILVPPPVVVRNDQRAAAPANDRWSWRFAAARLFGRA